MQRMLWVVVWLIGVTIHTSAAVVTGVCKDELPTAYVPIVSGRACTYIQFDCSGSHDPLGKNIVSYIAEFGDGTSSQIGPDPVFSHWYAQSGTYRVTLRVVTEDGRVSLEDASSIFIAPANQPPIVTFASEDTIEATQYSSVNIVCLIEDKDPEDRASVRVWFGDDDPDPETYGTSGRLLTISHVYSATGLFWVTVIANDAFCEGPAAVISVRVVDRVIVYIKYDKKSHRLTIDATSSSFTSEDSRPTIITVLVPHKKTKIPVTVTEDHPIKQMFGIYTAVGNEFSATSSSGGSVTGTIWSE
jgi:PKD repeat protein